MITRTHIVTRVALFAAVMTVVAQIRIPLGPVPFTLQTFGALTAGYCLGPAAGAAAMLLYTAVGLAGLPVFASGGGPAYVLTPTFGYIIGFILCAAVTGFLARFNRRESLITAYLFMLAGLAAVYIPGILWLVVSLHWIADVPAPVVNLLQIGLLVPLIGDLITTVPAAALSVRLRKVLT